MKFVRLSWLLCMVVVSAIDTKYYKLHYHFVIHWKVVHCVGYSPTCSLQSLETFFMFVVPLFFWILVYPPSGILIFHQVHFCSIDWVEEIGRVCGFNHARRVYIFICLCGNELDFTNFLRCICWQITSFLVKECWLLLHKFEKSESCQHIAQLTVVGSVKKLLESIGWYKDGHHVDGFRGTMLNRRNPVPDLVFSFGTFLFWLVVQLLSSSYQAWFSFSSICVWRCLLEELSNSA